MTDHTKNRGVFELAARKRWMTVGSKIPHNTPDLRLAIKREIWLRELTITDLAASMNIRMDYLCRILAGQQRLHPPLLRQLIAHLHITRAVARRLHRLAAIEAGWDIDLEETAP